MLSTQPLRTTDVAQYYSGQENYYAKESQGLWWGKGAAALGLQGQVDAQLLTALSQGQLPNGQLLGRVQEGKREHRPGWDLTFSAPKSVSLLALLGDSATRKAVEEAVLSAAQSTLTWIEEQGSRARVTHKGKTTAVATRNLTAALFLHDLSRTADPQLHVHAVVMNMTKRPDGVWRSLASQIKGYRQNSAEPSLGFLEHVRYHQQFYGVIFRSELALRLKEQGFTLTIDASRGFFEVAGISSAALAAYASRAQQIQEYVAQKGQSGAKAKSVATFLTRPAKGRLDTESLRALWQEKGQAAGVDAFAEVAAVLQEVALQKTVSSTESATHVRGALEKAISQYGERSTVLRGSILIQAAIAHTLGMASSQNILAAFEKLRKEDRLVALGAPHSDCYTTPELLAQEQQLITAAKTQEPLAAGLTPASLQAFLSEHAGFYPCQKAALRLLFLHPQRVQACTGITQSGKTFLISTLLQLVGLSGKRAVVLNVHPSAYRSVRAACSFTHRLLSVNTCLQKASHARLPKDTVLLVDNASSLPLPQLANLVALTQRSQARLILLGNTEGLVRSESTDALSILVQNGLSTARLSFPGKTSPPLSAHLPDIFHTLENRVIAIPDKEARLRTMVAQFAALPPEEQKSTLLVMPTLSSCQEVTTALRAALQSKGQLGPDRSALPVLLPKALHPTEKDLAKNYSVGDWLRYKGQYGRITHCDKKTQTLTLQTCLGFTTRFSLQRASKKGLPLDVFTENVRPLAPGDSLRSLVSQPRLKISAGERYSVIECSAKQLILVRENGRRLRLNTSRPYNRHWDYGYAVTPLSAVLPAPHCIIAYQKATSRLSQYRVFTHLLHRVQGNIWLYTEHKELLLQTLTQQKGVLPSLHENLSKEHSDKDPASAAVQHSIAHLSEREAAFHSEGLLLGEALRHSVGTVSPEAVQAALHAAEQDGTLEKGIQGLRTIQEALDAERAILNLAKTEHGLLAPLVEAATLESYLAANPLNPEQTQALTTWTQSKNPVVLIEGYAGTQKTTFLQKAQPLLKTSGFALETLAPTHTAVKELEARGLPARTLESFLHAPYPRTEDPPIYAVDEHSMVGNQKLLRFLEHAKTQGARVLLLGDRAQYTAIEAGNPQVLLPAAEIPTAAFTQIIRQKNPVLQQAVQHLYQGELPAAFACLQNTIIEIGKTSPGSLDNPEERYNRIAQDYSALSRSERAQTLVLTGSNAQRVALNTAIRDQLKNQGELKGESTQTTIWVAQDRSQTQLRDSRYYSVGQWLRSVAGEYQAIIAVHGSGKGLSLRTAEGETVFYLPEAEQGRVQLYQQEKREIVGGDTLRWTRSDTNLGLRSAEHIQVEHIENRCAWVRALAMGSEGFSPKGDAYSIPLDDPRYQHWDYAYALTGYAAQGKSIARVLCTMDSYSRYTSNARFFLIALTRSIHHFTLYTDNTAALLDKLIQTPALKYTALESIQEYPFTPKPQLKTVSPKTPVRIELDRITQDLHTHAETVVRQLLGNPLSQTTTHYRYSHSAVLGGEPTKTRGGSLFVAIRGPKAGLWHSFKTGEGGNLLQLIQKKVGGNFQKSVHIAQDLLGGETTFLDAPAVPKKITTPPTIERKSLAYARRLARESRKIRGTLAEQYLREHRGITLDTLPKDLRYHPGIYSVVNKALHPALLAIARNTEGQIQAIQAIYLDKDTGAKAKVSVVKQTWGSLAGAAVDLSNSLTSPSPAVLYLAEGIETALSLTQSLSNAQVKAVLGKSNFMRTSLPEGNSQIVLCLDNDGNTAPDPTIQKAATHLTEQGAQVWIAQPKTPGQDYSDMLHQEGSKAVKASVDSAWAFTVDRGEKGKTVDHLSLSLAEHLRELGRDSQKSITFAKPEVQKAILGQKVKEVEIEL